MMNKMNKMGCMSILFAAALMSSCSQGITAHSLAQKDAIRQVENGREYEPHQRWDKQF